MNDYKTTPFGIPSFGERFDQTIIDVGVGTSWHRGKDTRRPAIIVKTMGDNGKRAKKKLSAPFFETDIERYAELCRVVGIPVPKSNCIPIDDKMAVKDILLPLHNKIREGRFSSMVRPVEFETDRGRYVRYDMTFFDDAQNRSTLHLDSEPTQFQRP